MAARLPWLYDATPGRRLGIRRAWGTLARTLLPWRFWARVTKEVPVRPARLALWLMLILVPMYAVYLAAALLHRYTVAVALGDGWGMVVPPSPFWWELFFSFVWDAGEIAPNGRVEPLWFPPRLRWACLAAAVTPALALLALVSTRRAAGIRPRHLARIAVYAQLPAVGMFFWRTLGPLQAAAPEFLPGIRLGPAYYRAIGNFARAEQYCLVAWVLAWWWFAVTRGLQPRQPRRTAAFAAAVAMLTVAVIHLGHWRVWAVWMHAF